ncbi:DUF7793 family protein [Crocinitomix catalasitica]|uniref:DUF7793 family protein n=1 Tax=Crocinitomix catalasitica TaxID=184607 RepID=UPI00047F2871|nr:hypothetical protein [Crocinitomix catalasitica]
MTKEIVKTNRYSVTIIETDIVHIRFAEAICIEIEDVKATFDIYQELSEAQDRKIMVEFPDHTTITSEAREHGQAAEINADAEAFVITTLAQRILARFFKTFHKKKHPFKIFMNKEEALTWLINYKK